MPSCADRAGQRGFTLLELLLVVMIMGLAIGLVSFSVNTGSDAAELREEANRFASQSSLVMEEAILSGYPWGIEFYRQLDQEGRERYGYRWLSYTEEDGWLPEAPYEMPGEGQFSPGIRLELQVEGAEVSIDDRRDLTDEEWKNLQASKAGYDKRLAASAVPLDTNRSPLLPDILLLASRQATPATITLRVDDGDSTRQETVTIDLLGRIRLEAADAEQ